MINVDYRSVYVRYYYITLFYLSINICGANRKPCVYQVIRNAEGSIKLLTDVVVLTFELIMCRKYHDTHYQYNQDGQYGYNSMNWYSCIGLLAPNINFTFQIKEITNYRSQACSYSGMQTKGMHVV